MLKLSFSNRPEHLLDRLVDALGTATGDPFEPVQVVVPSAAVRRRIEFALADAHGICANIRFAYLAQWLWVQIGRVVPVSADSPFAPPVLAWRIYDILSDAAFVAEHPRLAAYLGRADDVMRLEVSQQLARLMDQYITYRPDWLLNWSRSLPAGVRWPDDSLAADENWQTRLWQRIETGIGLGRRHPASVFLERLQQDGRTPAGLPAEVHVFGLPSLPPLHLEILRGLSRHIDVHYYAVNPCEAYWFDLVDTKRWARLAAARRAEHTEIGHPLLAGWGKQTQAHLESLFDADDADALVVTHDTYEPAGEHTLLARLQSSILALEPMAPGSAPELLGDRSIEIHRCHSLTRELEVLHDRLLAVFAGDDPPAPGEVLVVVPDLERAAPLIDAVFGTAPPSRRIPFAITGQPARRINRVARALDDLLAMAAGRLTASAAIGLLEQAPVALRFDLAAEQLDTLRDWIRAAGIRWGADAEHRAALGLPASAHHSFDDGLQRLFMAYAMGDAGGVLGGRLPAGNPEGQAAVALGRFWRFIDGVRALQRDWRTPRDADGWRDALQDALEAFVAVSPEWVDELRPVQVALADLHASMQAGELSRAIPLDVVRRALADALDESARGGVPGGLVTFAAMASLRGLPYRVVCVLGLDDRAFPSTQSPAEFDLIAAAPRKGDRQRRHDERNLFLDLLLSARTLLHLSHSGHDIRDNSEQPPSVLVAELLDHLALACAHDPADPASIDKARRHLVVDHPLQAFSARYFVDGEAEGLRRADARVRSFDAEYCAALRGRLEAMAGTEAQRMVEAVGTIDGAVIDGHAGSPAFAGDDDDDESSALDPVPPFFTGPLPPPGPEWRDVELAQLQAFFRNPCRMLLVDRLGLRLGGADEDLQDDEPFLLDYRARQSVAQRLLEPAMQGAGIDALRALALAGPELPAGTLGQRMLETELGLIDAFAQALQQRQASPVQPVLAHVLTVDIGGEAWRLSGALADLRADGLVRHRYDDTRPRDYLEAWLLHLFACAARGPTVEHRTWWHSRDGAFAFEPCPDAPERLAELLHLYRQGLCAPLRFFPKSAWAFVESDGDAAKARRVWHNDQVPAWGEDADAALRLALRGLDDPLAEPFGTLAQSVFGPLRAHLRDPRR